MVDALVWYALISLAGWLAWPTLFRLMAGLPSRGYSYARLVGWLMWGWLYWWLGLTGLARPGRAAGLAALLGLVALSLGAARKPATRRRMGRWLRDQRGVVVSVELGFGLAFAAWLVVRAAAPEILGTEKPMELAFINALLRSEAFPPHDPWLAGYAISYYYFGYLLTALLAAVAGTPGPVAFNIAVALIFALAVIAAWGVGYDLLAPRLGRRAWAYAWFTPLLVLVVGNWEGLLEVLHRQGWGWRGDQGPFWAWLDILDLNTPPTGRNWPPRFWWWWRASRVVRDTALGGGHQEVIDEFPFFSFLLGDLHPHVLAIPFGLVAVAWAWQGLRRGTGAPGWRGQPCWSHFLFSALLLGGLSFLNTWDFPLYSALLAAAWVVRNRARGQPWAATVRRAAWDAAAVLVLGVLLYLPFYVGFGSQARGFLPNVLNPTRGAHLWVMFGPLLVVLWGVVGTAARSVPRRVWLRGVGWALAVTLGLAVLAWAMLGLITLLPAGDAYWSVYAAPDASTLVRAALARQARTLAGPLTLALLGGLALAALPIWPETRRLSPSAWPFAEPFPFMLVAWGALLVQAPNFVYVWDNFGTRMNTVFKFYYQAWQLWAVAAGYGLAVLLTRRRWIWSALSLLGLAAGLVYPALALPDRAANFRPAHGWTLDGSVWLQRTNPDDWAAAQALARARLGVVAEAVGGSYSEFARLSTYSGQPAVLGWPGHEGQWRGGYAEVGTRPQDMRTLYTTRDWNQARAILARYGIRYVALGDLERRAYGARPDLWEAHLRLWWVQGQTRIYVWEAPGPAAGP